jgi:hypothetical protein
MSARGLTRCLVLVANVSWFTFFFLPFPPPIYLRIWNAKGRNRIFDPVSFFFFLFFHFFLPSRSFCHLFLWPFFSPLAWSTMAQSEIGWKSEFSADERNKVINNMYRKREKRKKKKKKKEIPTTFFLSPIFSLLQLCPLITVCACWKVHFQLCHRRNIYVYSMQFRD